MVEEKYKWLEEMHRLETKVKDKEVLSDIEEYLLRKFQQKYDLLPPLSERVLSDIVGENN